MQTQLLRGEVKEEGAERGRKWRRKKGEESGTEVGGERRASEGNRQRVSTETAGS